MRRGIGAVVSILLVADCVRGAVAVAQTEQVSIAGWTVQGQFESGRFTNCSMSSSLFKDGRLFSFSLNSSGLSFGVFDPKMTLKKAKRVAGNYQLDDGPITSTEIIVLDDKTFFITPVLPRNKLIKFRSASTLRVTLLTAQYQGVSVHLKGSEEAFSRLFACVEVGVQSAGRAPERSPSDRQAVPPRPPVPPAGARPPATGKSADPSENAIGTGFYVSVAGHILTAEHVIRGCKSIRAQAIGDVAAKAALIAKSEVDDLALLKGEGTRNVAAPFRTAPLRLGEQIILFGFPLPGALASSGNLTTGNISALAGLKDDHRMMQVSAPAQPGNSGGPVLDLRGRVAGTVVSTVNALRVARATGTLPQNVNFAVKASVVLSFLEAHGVAVEQSVAAADLAVADVAERARAFTVRIECLQQ